MTPLSRYLANLAALRTLLELRDRPATREDLDKLALYEGWADERVRRLGFDGALRCQPELRRALEPLDFDPVELVTSEALASPQIPSQLLGEAVNCAARALAGGPRRVLCYGPGNAFAMAQTAARFSEIVFTILEPLPVFAEIARLAAPVYRHLGDGLGRQPRVVLLPEFDLIIGAPPLAGAEWPVEPVAQPAELRWRHLNLHAADFATCKLVSLLVPGGVAALFLPCEVMDRREPGAREWLAERATLLQAWRLPSDLWEGQGSAAIVDLTVWRKR